MNPIEQLLNKMLEENKNDTELISFYENIKLSLSTDLSKENLNRILQEAKEFDANRNNNIKSKVL
jgi:uncharacterized OsmC-like protein